MNDRFEELVAKGLGAKIVNEDESPKAEETQKETPKETWNRLDQNEKRRQQQLVKNWGLDKDPSIKQQVINYSPNKVNKDVYQPKKNFIKIF